MSTLVENELKLLNQLDPFDFNLPPGELESRAFMHAEVLKYIRTSKAKKHAVIKLTPFIIELYRNPNPGTPLD